MRVYFLSKIKAALKINGEFLGHADMFERRVELDLADGVFVELIPEGEYFALNFFVDEGFLHRPPAFIDLYDLGGDILIFAREYTPTNANFAVIAQASFCNNLVTVFSQGKIFVAFEGKEYFIHELPYEFKQCKIKDALLCNKRVCVIEAENYVAILSELGKLLFLNKITSYNLGENLSVCVDFENCLKQVLHCKFLYDGTALTLAESKTVDGLAPTEELLHFAFFESVLTCGDYARFLCAELKDKARHLKEFLGDFCAVTVPPERFFAKHGEIFAVGLVYPKGKNLFKVKYFAVEILNGEICNIFQVE
ncbi:MAG: hypothetical protein E7370_03535 [Clostridiales bacterium]|nr:hypothetical protein [Clostridiales bacterium]